MPTITAATAPPILVDLDGTLVLTDSLWELFLVLIRVSPWKAFVTLFSLFRGRAAFKRKVAESTPFSADLLPFNHNLVSYLRQEAATDRRIYLLTGADESIAREVSRHLGFFSGVMASDGLINLTGKRKLGAITSVIGKQSFIYAANSKVDVPVWIRSEGAIVVNASRALERDLRKRGINVVHSFNATKRTAVFRTLRISQWVKNLLVFVPLALRHSFGLGTILEGLTATLAFCLTASAIYIFNDLLDLHQDRRHPRKKFRPFASGQVSIPTGVLTACLALSGAAAIGAFLPASASAYLAIYAAVAVTYSFWLKRLLFVDVVVLALFYTVRILYGAAATDVPLSVWTAAFSMFAFLTLALVKRLGELRVREKEGKGELGGRAYRIVDFMPLCSLASASSYVAVLVMALYINSPEARATYRHPELLWLLCPILILWFSYVILLANRGTMDDDPIHFAMTNKPSLAVAAVAVAIALGAA
jgi:4-hydroxybenzoate polyprenyltransferase